MSMEQEVSDSDAHIYSKEEVIQSFIDDLEVISDTESNISDEEKTVRTENSEKIRKILRLHKDAGYIKYVIIKGKKQIKIECYGTVQNTGNYIRCPYTGIRSNDRVGSNDENYYFKAALPGIGKGDVNFAYYYETPEAFERHHLVILSQDVKNKFYERKK